MIMIIQVDTWININKVIMMDIIDTKKTNMIEIKIGKEKETKIWKD